MQLISLLAALSISAILASQAVSTWSTPQEASMTKQDTAILSSTIRRHMATAISTKTTQVIQMPITQRPIEIQSSSGNQLEACSNRSVSQSKSAHTASVQAVQRSKKETE